VPFVRKVGDKSSNRCSNKNQGGACPKWPIPTEYKNETEGIADQ